MPLPLEERARLKFRQVCAYPTSGGVMVANPETLSRCRAMARPLRDFHWAGNHGDEGLSEEP